MKNVLKRLTRATSANILIGSFIIMTSIGAFLIDVSVGFISAGIACGIVGLLLGLE